MVSDKANGRYSRMLDTRSRMRTLIIAIVSAFSLLLSSNIATADIGNFL